MDPHFSPPCEHSCVKNGRLLRFPKIFIKRQTWWSNDKTIILLNMVIAKYRDLSVSRRTIICQSRKICSPLKNQDILLHLVINLKTIEHWLWASKMWDRLVLWASWNSGFFQALFMYMYITNRHWFTWSDWGHEMGLLPF